MQYAAWRQTIAGAYILIISDLHFNYLDFEPTGLFLAILSS